MVAIQKFDLGQVVATPGAVAALERSMDGAGEYIFRHASGDWGEICDEDKAQNDAGIEGQDRLLSAYRLSDGTRIWLITEWDRSVTTLLLPEEY